MNGCIYRTKYGECSIPNRSVEYGPLCCSDCTDQHPSNADSIRAMTDEELAELLDGGCGAVRNGACPNVEMPFILCRECWLEWLRQEAQDG